MSKKDELWMRWRRENRLPLSARNDVWMVFLKRLRLDGGRGDGGGSRGSKETIDDGQ